MNFMSGRSGFYEEAATGTRGMSSSSSSSPSSSFQHRGLTPFTHHHQDAYGGATAPPPPPADSSSAAIGGGGEDEPDDHLQLLRRGGEGSSAAAAIQREHMFDKVVTPSDVGKLNRLVIPKQHAEKYFPLDSSTNEKGLLLNFEDRNGKPWRFRYSYWNSSQSYVMTKGWSRFVKEKKLDAGDIVSFQRGVGDLGRDRLFIDWRRRPDAPDLQPPIPALSFPHHQISFHRSVHPWSPFFMPQPTRDYQHLLQSNAITAPHHHFPTGYGPYSYNSIVNGNPCPPGSILYVRSAPGNSSGGGGGRQQIGGSPQAAVQRGEQMVYESVPVVQGKAAAKRLRLFGVNMDCPISESDDCDILSSTTLAHPTLPLHHLPPTPSSLPSLHLSPNYHHDDDDVDDDDDNDKGKGSMSLDLDI